MYFVFAVVSARKLKFEEERIEFLRNFDDLESSHGYDGKNKTKYEKPNNFNQRKEKLLINNNSELNKVAKRNEKLIDHKKK